MGDAAGKMVHEGVDYVKGAVSSATDGLQSAVGLGGTGQPAAGAGAESQATLPRNGSDPDACKHIPLKGPDKEMAAMIDDIMETPRHAVTEETIRPLDKFKPTPVPSFDKPPTPNATAGALADILETPMEKIDEASSAVTATIDDLTDDLLKETEAVATEVKATSVNFMKQKLPPLETIKSESMLTEAMAMGAPVVDPIKAEMKEMEAAVPATVEQAVVAALAEMVPAAEPEPPAPPEPVAPDPVPVEGQEGDLEYDLRPTKWEALADAIVELPPRMSIDLGTGQLYAVVDDDPAPRRRGPPPPPMPPS